MSPIYKASFALLVAVGLLDTQSAYCATVTTITRPKQSYKKKTKLPVRFTTFIPMNWVDDPTPFTSRIFDGDDREFNVNGITFRTRQSITMIPVITLSQFGFDGTTEIRQTGVSVRYDKASSLGPDNRITAEAKADTVLGDGYLKDAVGQASANDMTTSPSRIADRKVSVELAGDVGNPVPFFSCNITWSFNLEIDATDKSNPKFKLSGNRSRFPAQEMYIGQQAIFTYDPRPSGTVTDLCLPTIAITPIEGAIQ